jgi:hypothetical protein
VTEIREQEEYDGRRLRFDAYLARARITVKIDIGFGDAITPNPIEISYPTLLDFPPPRLKAYPRESVVSEKLQAMVALGMPNSRMKDFYDIWVMARLFDFDGETLVEAIKATFARRATDIPHDEPVALTDDFAADSDKRTQWRAFVRRAGIADEPPDLATIIRDLRQFALPPLLAAAGGLQFHRSWNQGAWQ